MTARRPAFSGLVPPVVTPLTADGEIDVPSLERLVGFLLEGGVDGLFALGSSSETAYLTEAQRTRVLEVVIGANAGQVPVIAGCIETTTNRVIERAAISRESGADAVVA
ncbi:MAG: dihydrodipicolinate synthase family protein, partial [Kitasatospora sp.]|nr:dihydrodipicolinate synthase family protein [Kitasatospora sp.]